MPAAPKTDSLPAPLRRIMVVGGPGSGKSHVGREIARRTGLPLHHMDQIHYQPGWVPRPMPEKIALARAVEAREDWVFEGNFSATYDERAARADLLVWLDLPVGLRFARVLWRTLRDYGRVRPDMAPGCPEGFHAETWPFWKWIFTSRRPQRAKILRLIADHPELAVVHLQRRVDVTGFLATLSTPDAKETPP